VLEGAGEERELPETSSGGLGDCVRLLLPKLIGAGGSMLERAPGGENGIFGCSSLALTLSESESGFGFATMRGPRGRRLEAIMVLEGRVSSRGEEYGEPELEPTTTRSR